MPEYRIINNHLFDMQNDFSTALVISLRKKHQYSAHSQSRKRLLTQDEYNQNLIDKMFSADFLARHGLTDAVMGGKVQMVHSSRQFILVKLPLDLQFPEVAEESSGEGGNLNNTSNPVKTKEQQQLEHDRKVTVKMHLMLAELANNQPVLQVEMRHFHPQLKAAQEWMEKNTAKVKKVILPGIGRTSKEDKKAFSGYKNKTVYRKRGAKLGVTEKYGADDKMIEDETLTYIKKRPSRKQRQ